MQAVIHCRASARAVAPAQRILAYRFSRLFNIEMESDTLMIATKTSTDKFKSANIMVSYILKNTLTGFRIGSKVVVQQRRALKLLADCLVNRS